MKKIIAISIAAFSLVILASSSFAFTGLFYKAFSRNFAPDEIFENNITIRKFYNLTIKFQKEGSTSDLTIKNVNTSIILKDGNYSQIQKFTGFNGTSLYSVVDKQILDKIKFVSSYNVSNSANSYEDVEDQPVSFSLIGTKATMVIKVSPKNSTTTVSASGNSTFQGYLIDDLTNLPVENIEVAIFSSDSKIVRNYTDSNGKFILSFSPGNYDVFVGEYAAI